MPKTVGIRDLKNQTSQILRKVREDQMEYVITYQGKPVAVLRPYLKTDADSLKDAEIQAEMEWMRAMAAEVAESWISPKSGVELVDEQRR